MKARIYPVAETKISNEPCEVVFFGEDSDESYMVYIGQIEGPVTLYPEEAQALYEWLGRALGHLPKGEATWVCPDCYRVTGCTPEAHAARCRG